MSPRKELLAALLLETVPSTSATSSSVPRDADPLYKYLVYLLREIQSLTYGIVHFQSTQDKISYEIGSESLLLVIRRMTMIALLKPALLEEITRMVAQVLNCLELEKTNFSELPLTTAQQLLKLDTATREYFFSESPRLAQSVEKFIKAKPNFFIFTNLLIHLTGV